MTKTRSRWCALGTLVLVGVSLFGLCVFGLVLMRPAAAQVPELAEIPTTDLTSLDPHWLKLIRGESSKQGLAPSQAQSPQTLNVLLSDRLVAGRANSGSTVYISHTRGVTVIASAIVRPIVDGGSFFYASSLPFMAYCSREGICYDSQFSPGDVMQVSQAGSILAMTLPTLTAASYARDDDVRGMAPPSQTVSVSWYSARNSSFHAEQIVTATAEGAYEADFAGSVDIYARDTGFVILETGPNTTAAQQYVAPFVRAQANGTLVSGYMLPNQSFSIYVKSVTNTLNPVGASYSDSDGSFSFKIGLYEGFALAPGSVLMLDTSSQPFSMTLENISARASYTLAQVMGVAPANRLVQVAVVPGPVPLSDYPVPIYTPTHSVTSSATSFFSAAVMLKPGDFGAVSVTDAEGNQTFASFVLTYARARMGNAVFHINTPEVPYLAPFIGQLDVFSEPLTITIQGASGFIKDIRSAYVWGDTGYFRMNTNNTEGLGLSAPLFGSGDVISVQSRLGTHISYKLPTLTAEANIATDGVTGTAPPGAELRIRLGSTDPSQGMSIPTPVPNFAQPNAADIPAPLPFGPIPLITQTVTVAADGTFVANFAGRMDINTSTLGEVEWVSPEGYAAVLPFYAHGVCVPRLGYVDLIRSAVGVEMFTGYPNSAYCPQYRVRLLNAQGIEKGSTPQSSTGTESTFFGQKILPGDTLELLNINQVFARVRVPRFAMSLDPTTDVVSGTILPNTTLGANVVNAADFDVNESARSTYFTATAGANGSFSQSLRGVLDVVPGTAIQLRFGSEPIFLFQGAVPWMRAYLYQSRFDAAIANIVSLSGSFSMTQDTFASLARQAFPITSIYVTRTVAPGDQISVNAAHGTTTLNVPMLLAKLDVVKNTVTGKAPPNARLRIKVYSTNNSNGSFPNPGRIISQEVMVNGTGMFTATFAATETLASTASLFYFAPNGSEVVLRFGLPHWDVIIGERFVSGRAASACNNATVSLRSANGALKSSSQCMSDESGYFFVSFTATVMGGDRLELVQPGETSRFVVPPYSASYDKLHNLVKGFLIPNTFVQVSLPDALNPYSNVGIMRQTQSDSAGRFVLDTTGLPLYLSGTGQVLVGDVEGNTIKIKFAIAGYQRFLPLVFR